MSTDDRYLKGNPRAVSKRVQKIFEHRLLRRLGDQDAPIVLAMTASVLAKDLTLDDVRRIAEQYARQTLAR